MTKVKRTKVPARRVASDDFVIAIDGREYRPHAGEWVELRGAATVADLLLGLKLNRLANPQGMSEEELEATLGEVVEYLCRRIVAWTWTDDAGDPLPSPPTPAVLRQLSLEELNYLLTVTFGGLRSEAENLNGSRPST